MDYRGDDTSIKGRQIYPHVLNRGAGGVLSPLDR